MLKQIMKEYRIVNVRELMKRPSTREFTDFLIRVIALVACGMLLYIIVLTLFSDERLMIVTNENGELYPMLAVMSIVTLFAVYKFAERIWEIEMSARKSKQVGPMPDFKGVEPKPSVIPEPVIEPIPEPTPEPPKRGRRKATVNVEIVTPKIAEPEPRPDVIAGGRTEHMDKPVSQIYEYDTASEYDQSTKANGYWLVALIWGVIVIVGIVLVFVFTM